MRTITAFLVSFVLLAALAPPATAQHADFVLFGDPNPAAKDAPEEHHFVHPVTSPFYHEDSFVTSDVRLWAIYHDFPKSSPIDGGSAKAVAAQLRVALTDQLQLVAYKDGYVDFDSGAVGADGLFDLAAGLKWGFLQDWENQLHAAVGVGYEFKTGNGRVLQNDSEWRFWASVNKGFDHLHLGATFNYMIGEDKDRGLGNSDRFFWHLHADYYVCKWFSPVVELNGYHVVNSGSVAVPFQGTDVASLGGVMNGSMISLGIGGEFRVMDNIAVRVAYETPLTSKEDLYGYRWTGSLVWSF